MIGFISHVDTSPEVTDTNVKPQAIKDYKGGVRDKMVRGKNKNAGRSITYGTSSDASHRPSGLDK